MAILIALAILSRGQKSFLNLSGRRSDVLCELHATGTSMPRRKVQLTAISLPQLRSDGQHNGIISWGKTGEVSRFSLCEVFNSQQDERKSQELVRGSSRHAQQAARAIGINALGEWFVEGWVRDYGPMRPAR